MAHKVATCLAYAGFGWFERYGSTEGLLGQHGRPRLPVALLRKWRYDLKRFSTSLLWILPLAWITAACSASRTSSAIEQLDQAEQKWTAQGITSYRIEVLVVSSVWHAQSHQITVQSNQVVDGQAGCIPAPMEPGVCEVRAYVAKDYMVPGLFALARSAIQSEQTAGVQITYDPSYGFPSQVSYNDPELVDEDWSWQVTAFEIIK